MIKFALNNKCLHLSCIFSPCNLHIVNNNHWCFHFLWTFYFKLQLKHYLNILGIFYLIVNPNAFNATLIVGIYLHFTF